MGGMTEARVVLAFAALSIMALFWSVPSIRVALTERAPHEMSCADFVRQPPEARWVRLVGCVADDNVLWGVAESRTTRVASHEPTEGYVLYRPVDANADAVISIIVRRQDPEILALARGVEDPGMMRRLAKTFREPIVGMVDRGLPEVLRNELPNLKLKISQQSLVIDNGAHPLLGFSLVIFVLGVLGALGVIAWTVQRLRHGPPTKDGEEQAA